MMYNSNKKVGNKYAIIFVSFLLFISSLLAFNPLWLNKFYGETLCASSTAPTLDSSYFNYKDSNFLNKFDFACSDLVNFGLSSSSYSLTYKLIGLNDNAFSAFTTSLLFANSSSMMYFGPNSIGTNSQFNSTFDYYTASSYDFSNVRFTYYSSYGYYANQLIFGSNYNVAWISNLDFVYSWSYNNTYYVGMSSSLYNKYLAYQAGLADADTDTAYQNGYTAGQTDGYNNGYTTGKSDGITQGQNNVINNPNDYNLYDQSQYESNYTNGYNAGYSAGVIQGQNNVINNPSQFGLYTQSQYESNYTNGYNDGINNVVSNPSNYNLYTQSQYDQNYQDGVESTTNYQDGLANGIIQGQNNVLNNPNDYDLYTQSQYEDNYTNGYNFATNLSKYGFTYESDLYVQLTDQAEFVPISYNYYENGIKLTEESISYITNNFVVSNNYIKFKLVAKYDLNIMYPTFNFFENGVSQNTIDTFGGTAKDIDSVVQSMISLQYFYNSINRDGIVTGDNVANFNPASYRGGDWTGTISQQYLNTDLYNVTLYNYDSTHKYYTYNTLEFGFDFNASDLSKLFISDYNQSYINGYEDGRTMINSNAYNEGYDSGYDTAYNLSYTNAYNEGKSDGINSANEYSFYSLISSVVDAPLNMFKSMFNFEFLGINLFSFFTSIFTLCLVIFIISKFLKK